MECSLLLRQVALRCQQILGTNLVGITVHGSLAFGCFHWNSSDVDFLVVTHTIPTQAQKAALIQSLLDLTPLSPPAGRTWKATAALCTCWIGTLRLTSP